jgi:hypothetical protein
MSEVKAPNTLYRESERVMSEDLVSLYRAMRDEALDILERGLAAGKSGAEILDELDELENLELPEN